MNVTLFDPAIVWVHFSTFLAGAKLTLILSVWAVLLSFVSGVAGCWLGMSKYRVPRLIAYLYIEIARNTPLLLFLYVAYFSLGDVGIPISAEACAVVAIGLQGGGYSAEIFRGAFKTVSDDQRLAALALALKPRQRIVYVELPQMLRVAFPAQGNVIVGTVLGTSLASAIGVPELTLESQIIGARTYQYFSIFLVDALLYLLLVQVFLLSWRVAEKKFFGKWGI